MIAQAIKAVVELSHGHIFERNGKNYASKEFVELAAPEAIADPVEFHTLAGLIEYVKKGFDDQGTAYGLFVDGPAKVSMMSTLFGEFKQRQTLAVCSPFLPAHFPFGRYLDPEEMVVRMQAEFVQDETTAAILKIVGNLQSEAVQQYDDDGTSQTVTARSGITKVANVKVPNPVVLRPFRTFQELDQPESRYVLRMRRDHDGLPECALFEVNDLMWKPEALWAVKARLDKAKVGLPVFA